MTKTTSFAALLLGGLLCSGSVFAQTASMQDRLDRLESGVEALGGRVEVAQAYPSPYARGQTAEIQPSLAADFEVRLQKLERALSELTGRYEEATYQISQMKDRLERVNSDIDFRLKELESKGGGAASDPFGAPAKPSAPAAAPSAAKAPEKTPEKQYERAFELLRQSDYDKAEKAFTDFLAKNKGHQLAGNAQYWLGETYYVRNKFQDAAVAFAEGVQKYPKNNKAADNLLKLGMSLQQLNQKKDACTAFNQLISKFPEASASVKRRADTERRRLNCA